MKLILSDRTLALPECGFDVEWIDLSQLDITNMYISRIRYGGYDTPMKTMLERAIPIQQAFIRLVEGETHHVQRRVVPKRAVIIGYGARSDAERALFRRLVARNARNMNFERHRVVFAAEQDLEQIVREEVLAWEASC